MSRRAGGLLALLLAGCGLPAPVEPWRVRVDGRLVQALAPAGAVRATEDPLEGLGRGVDPAALHGDPVDLRRDAGLRGPAGGAAGLEARVTDDDELRVEARWSGRAEGRETFDRPRRFDGRVFPPGERVSTVVEARALQVSYARRLVALGDEAGLRVDVLARGGVEGLAAVDASLRGRSTPGETRQLRYGLPLVGAEVRARLTERLVAWFAAGGGAWSAHGERASGLDAGAGLRLAVAGPLDLELRWDVSLRRASKRYDEGEVSEARLLWHGPALGVALRF